MAESETNNWKILWNYIRPNSQLFYFIVFVILVNTVVTVSAVFFLQQGIGAGWQKSRQNSLIYTLQ